MKTIESYVSRDIIQGEHIIQRPDTDARIIGIDPGFGLCGFASVSFRWDNGKAYLDQFAAIPAKGQDHQAKVTFLGRAYETIISFMDPRMMAIELPFTGRGYRSNVITGQSRLLQHIIDVAPRLYYALYSEIHNTSVKAAVLKKGDPRKKPMVIQRVCELFDLKIEGNEKYQEAVCDAAAIALAFIKRTNEGPRKEFK